MSLPTSVSANSSNSFEGSEPGDVRKRTGVSGADSSLNRFLKEKLPVEMLVIPSASHTNRDKALSRRSGRNTYTRITRWNGDSFLAIGV